MDRVYKKDIQKIYDEVCKILEIDYVPLVFDQYVFEKNVYARYWTPIIINERLITLPSIRLNRVEVNKQLKYDIVEQKEFNVYAEDKIELYTLLIIHELTHAQRDKKFKYEDLAQKDIACIEPYTHTDEFNNDAMINFQKCKPYMKVLQYLEKIS